MPRFVILQHEMPSGSERPTHFDFMLEREDMLWTWALPQQPSQGRTMPAMRLADHRMAYLDYEGEVSGGRGRVTRWDQGTFEITEARPPDEPLALTVMLSGQRIAGEVQLTCSAETADQWLFLWKGS